MSPLGRLVVLARPGDPTAGQLAPYWPGQVSKLSPSDLSLPGWEWDASCPNDAKAVVGGEIVDSSDIAAVITRQTWITETDIPWIAQEDRAYMSVEMSAFLVAVLSSWSCPVWNDPTPGCLSGPDFHPAEWRALAAAVGWQLSDAEPEWQLAVVGDECWGARGELARVLALELAAKAEVTLLGIAGSGTGSGSRLCQAGIRPELGDPAVAASLARQLSEIAA